MKLQNDIDEYVNSLKEVQINSNNLRKYKIEFIEKFGVDCYEGLQKELARKIDKIILEFNK